jgi:hypothetical protein
MKATLLEGIIEADETLFARSEKGNRTLERKARKRGMKGKNTYEAVLSSVSTEQLNKELQSMI